jgi:transcriptional regulator with XRE-family HTH domain
MVGVPANDRRHELGAFLRAHRARLRPTALGLPAGQRRRTPGLRREEVAQLAGVSATWYSWIEQGREVSASATALARLATALQLAPAERRYLFDLAAKRDPAAPTSDGVLSETPAPLARTVEAIATPAYILDRQWNALAWNDPARRLFVGWLDGSGPETHPNLLRFIFLAPAARRFIRSWEQRAHRVLAEFRAECGVCPEDAGMHALVEELSAKSRLFARLWAEHDVLEREGGRREFHHPADGLLVYEQIGFALAGRPEVKLVMLIPAAARRRPSEGAEGTP